MLLNDVIKNQEYKYITFIGPSCEFSPDLDFGQIKCSSQGDDIRCIITCQEGYAIPLGQEDTELGKSYLFFLQCVPLKD